MKNAPATRSSRAAALALAALLAASLAACDSTEDASAQGSPSASPTRSWDPMAGTTPVTKAPTATATATATPTQAAGYDEAKQLLAATPARQAAAAKDHKTIKCDTSGIALQTDDVQTVFGDGLTYDAYGQTVPGGASGLKYLTVPGLREGDVVQACVGFGKAKPGESSFRTVWVNGQKVKPDSDGWYRADVVVPFTPQLYVPGPWASADIKVTVASAGSFTSSQQDYDSYLRLDPRPLP